MVIGREHRRRAARPRGPLGRARWREQAGSGARRKAAGVNSRVGHEPEELLRGGQRRRHGIAREWSTRMSWRHPGNHRLRLRGRGSLRSCRRRGRSSRPRSLHLPRPCLDPRDTSASRRLLTVREASADALVSSRPDAAVAKPLGRETVREKVTLSRREFARARALERRRDGPARRQRGRRLEEESIRCVLRRAPRRERPCWRQWERRSAARAPDSPFHAGAAQRRHFARNLPNARTGWVRRF